MTTINIVEYHFLVLLSCIFAVIYIVIYSIYLHLSHLLLQRDHTKAWAHNKAVVICYLWVRNSGAAQLVVPASTVYEVAVGHLGLPPDSSQWLLHVGRSLVYGLEDSSSCDSRASSSFSLWFGCRVFPAWASGTW